MGVGANESPFLSNCSSGGVSVCVLRLCMPMSDLVLFFGLSLKNDQFSFVSWLVDVSLGFFS